MPPWSRRACTQPLSTTRSPTCARRSSPHVCVRRHAGAGARFAAEAAGDDMPEEGISVTRGRSLTRGIAERVLAEQRTAQGGLGPQQIDGLALAARARDGQTLARPRFGRLGALFV